MDAIGSFFHDVLMLILYGFCILVFAGIVLASIASSNHAKLAEEKAKKRAETDAADAEYDRNCDTACSTVLTGWHIVERLKVDDRPGRVALSDDGLALRFVTWSRQGNAVENVREQTYPTRKVIGLSIDQPQVSRVVTHKEQTPVAMNVRRSAGGRALVGGLVAGPAGAIIGGASGLNGKTKVKMIETERHETVYAKGHPTLVVQLDDFATPRRSLVFADVKTTNDWSSRIHAAMHRARL